MVRRAFDILGIEVTRDVREIKKAYAALVKQYHPEEYPAEWARIHEAYQRAVEYAKAPEAASESALDGRFPDEMSWENVPLQEDAAPQEQAGCREEEHWQDAQVIEDAAYGTIFQEEMSSWAEEKAEHRRLLQERLHQLAALWNKKAVKEWEYFFQEEFSRKEGADGLLLLLEIVRKHKLSEDILFLVQTEMEDRIDYYDSRGEADCKRLAEEISMCCQIRCAQSQKTRQRPVQPRKTRRRPLSRLWIIPALVFAFFVIALSGRRAEKVKEGRTAAEAAAYLNEKYGEGRYSEEELTAEKETLFGDHEEEMECYRILEQASGSVIVCAVRDLESEDKAYYFFDNLQEEEIRQAFEEKVNERTGRSEGQLFWDSKTEDYSSGGIRDGFFQTRYDGNFDVFIRREAEVRKNVPKTAGSYISIDSGSLNGVCDYYLPDPEVTTMREKFERQDFPEDAGLQGALEECAADYEIQIRGVVLPQSFFAEKMKKAAWDKTRMTVGSDVVRNLGLEPSVSFLMLTGWYLNLPPEEEKGLNISNGMYTRETIQMGEGIYGAESRISSNYFEMEPEWMTDSIKRINTPESVELTEAERERAVSFQMVKGFALQNDCCLAVDKEMYGIADAGYRVILTEYYGDSAQNYEQSVREYGETGAWLRSGDILDGEGYIFMKYSGAGSADEAQVVTVINP